MNTYRFYCEDEACLIYVTATATPTTCPNNAEHIIRSGSMVINIRNNPTIPDVTPRQIRIALYLSMGLGEADIDALINTFSEPTKTIAMAEWKYSNVFERNRPLVISMGEALGKTSQEIDSLWLYAGTL